MEEHFFFQLKKRSVPPFTYGFDTKLTEESCFLLFHIFLTKMIRGYHNLSFETSFVEIDLLNIYVSRQNPAAEPMWYDSGCISNFNILIMVLYLQLWGKNCRTNSNVSSHNLFWTHQNAFIFIISATRPFT